MSLYDTCMGLLCGMHGFGCCYVVKWQICPWVLLTERRGGSIGKDDKMVKLQRFFIWLVLIGPLFCGVFWFVWIGPWFCFSMVEPTAHDFMVFLCLVLELLSCWQLFLLFCFNKCLYIYIYLYVSYIFLKVLRYYVLENCLVHVCDLL